MVSWFKQLFAYFKSYHQPSPLLLRYMIFFGVIGYPLMYGMRYVRSSSGYDDFMLRMTVVSLLLLLAARNYWPKRLQACYLPACYIAMTIALPFTLVFTSLKNGGGPAAVGNTFMSVFLLMLLADWRNFIVMLIVGFGAAAGIYAWTDPNPQLPLEYVLRLPVLVVGVVGGSLFKFALEQATVERVRQAYASLAGSIAHEMRNPMAQVRYSLDNIRQALPVLGAHEQGTFGSGTEIERLHRHVSQGEMAVQRGLQVITMTLDEVNDKPLDSQRFAYLSAAQVCAKAVEEYGYDNDLQRAKVKLLIHDDFVFRGDETAVLFVLFNLMKNALYYLSIYPDARLQISVGSNLIVVRDDGPGMDAEVLQTLFKPFRSTGKLGGTGLGLAYCHRVMRAFGGDIRCESVLGSHTEFILSFPPVDAKELEARGAAFLIEVREQWAGRRLLVVDDDSALRMSTLLMLQPLDVVVEEAADGLQALDALRAHSYDVVVLDLNMPGMSGYELAERVRRGDAPANRHTCLLARTSESGHLTRVKIGNAGFDGFVSKPVDRIGLLDAVNQAMHARERGHWSARDRLKDKRVLLVDDNPCNRAAIAAYLRQAGAHVLETDSGDAALHELRRDDAWHAVVLDIHMPGMSGIELARAIRALGGCLNAVPILAVTAHAGDDEVAEARAVGVGDFVLKPVEAPLLYERLGSMVGLQPLKREVASATVAIPVVTTLINVCRLEGFLRIGLVDELLGDYLPRIHSLVEQLAVAANERDRQRAIDVLHSLVGTSGEVGAQALHHFSRGIYVPLLERQQWPSQDIDWLAQLRDLAQHTNRELLDWVALRRSSVTE
ncbi:MAG: response regulator [Hydrogenophaga sp.]|uniref:ATP-binding response regulator n=1 Tax=Hydrogenophaga sp. TaxID=1904254 RepID=UPI0016A8C770|nr:response regulator [Hydrogenophaga sp.]NIM42388.1 response regulator [Hydrogenophaga sp.]NIN27543.1 response regulator [Hydrogenophaga sp.]NIN32362.1 response regulator [Hydrogenophaga sp.]NIN56596.1 response regulator [Hydrogenophaga sp.]NIO52959.1 response regulator [Hydrogenophaga sp.]